jgi:hypothetical protein
MMWQVDMVEAAAAEALAFALIGSIGLAKIVAAWRR